MARRYARNDSITNRSLCTERSWTCLRRIVRWAPEHGQYSQPHLGGLQQKSQRCQSNILGLNRCSLDKNWHQCISNCATTQSTPATLHGRLRSQARRVQVKHCRRPKPLVNHPETVLVPSDALTALLLRPLSSHLPSSFTSHDVPHCGRPGNRALRRRLIALR